MVVADVDIGQAGALAGRQATDLDTVQINGPGAGYAES